MDISYLPFEKQIEGIDAQRDALIALSKARGICFDIEICELRENRNSLLGRIYNNLDPAQTIQVARHPQRPLFQDYIREGGLIFDFKELHGDGYYGDDRSIMAGLGMVKGEKFMIIGQNKGRTTKEKIYHNFGCASPEGYRKAHRLMKFAEKFNLPVLTFIDTPGAYPGIGAEERGQAKAIAENLALMSRLKTPIISIVIGEGGSGGALGIGVADRLAMLEHSYYSVISPEGCAAILWKDAKYSNEAAKELKLRSRDLLKLKLIDTIIPEPLGGAHRDYQQTFKNIRKYIWGTISELKQIPIEELVEQRYKKLRNIGSDAIKVMKPKRKIE